MDGHSYSMEQILIWIVVPMICGTGKVSKHLNSSCADSSLVDLCTRPFPDPCYPGMAVVCVPPKLLPHVSLQSSSSHTVKMWCNI